MVHQRRQDQEEQKELPQEQVEEEEFFEVVADNDEDEEESQDAISAAKEAASTSSQQVERSRDLAEGQNEEKTQSQIQEWSSHQISITDREYAEIQKAKLEHVSKEKEAAATRDANRGSVS